MCRILCNYKQNYTQTNELTDFLNFTLHLQEIKAGIESYAEAVSQASRRAEKVVRDFEHLGASVGDLGLSLIRLGKYEDEVGGACGAYTDVGAGARDIAADSRRLGMSSVRMSRFARSATAESMNALEPLHAELALVPAVVDALKEREAAMLTCQSIRDNIVKKKASIVMMESSTEYSKMKKVDALKNEVAALEIALEAAEGEYEKVKQRNVEELVRWQEERSLAYASMVESYGRVCAAYEERGMEVWNGVAEDFGME